MEQNKENMDAGNFGDTLNASVQNFYAMYFSSVKAYILNNSGSQDDAKDIFQEVAFAYFKNKAKADPLQIENEKNYVLGIARNIWLKKLKSNKKTNVVDVEFLENISDDPVDELEEKQSDLIDVVLNKLQEMSEECRKIIYAAFYLKLSAIKIAEQTGYSEKFIKVKKYRCLQSLKKTVTGSPDYRSFQM